MSDDWEALQDEMSRLPDEMLLRIAASAAGDYRPEAAELARMELSRRGVREIPAPGSAPPEEPPEGALEDAARDEGEAAADLGSKCVLCHDEARPDSAILVPERGTLCGVCISLIQGAIQESARRP